MTYGFTVVQTSFKGSLSKWGVSDCLTIGEARYRGYKHALNCGWTQPKWWQWWRRTDTRIDSESLRDIFIYIEMIT